MPNISGFGASIFDDMLDGGGAGRLPGTAATSTTTYQTGDGGTVHITRYLPRLNFFSYFSLFTQTLISFSNTLFGGKNVTSFAAEL